MADKIIEEKVVKKNNSHSFYDAQENNDALYEQIGKQATNALFDNSHKTDNLQKVYGEIEQNKMAYEVEKREIKTKSYRQSNPFFGDSNALERMSMKNYKEVVDKKDEPSDVLEVKNDVYVKPIERKNKKVQRKHLWITTISICLVLFGFVFGYNMFSINSLAKNTAKTQHKISEIEQQMLENDVEYYNIAEDLGMTEADLEAASKIDLSPQNTTPRYAESSSAWDRFCDFFAHLFGK